MVAGGVSLVIQANVPMLARGEVIWACTNAALAEEEVIREREMRHARETRLSLTRFIATIIIATLLEAVVIAFKVAREQVSDLIYPTLLIFAGVALLVGLGAYQRLSAAVEEAVGEEPGGSSADKHSSSREVTGTERKTGTER